MQHCNATLIQNTQNNNENRKEKRKKKKKEQEKKKKKITQTKKKEILKEKKNGYNNTYIALGKHQVQNFLLNFSVSSYLVALFGRSLLTNHASLRSQWAQLLLQQQIQIHIQSQLSSNQIQRGI
jgi:hypothetical protein